jgi:hypothetical protein
MWPETEETIELDLGDGHSLTWTRYGGERVGGVIKHTTDKTKTGFCEGAFWIRGNTFNREQNRPSAEWDMTGTFEVPSLTQSFLCHCGDHGYIREGRWVKA